MSYSKSEDSPSSASVDSSSTSCLVVVEAHNVDGGLLDNKKLLLVPFNDGLVAFAMALVGYDGEEQKTNTPMDVRERYARAYLVARGVNSALIDQCWGSVTMLELFADAAGVSEAVQGYASEYQFMRHVIVRDPTFVSRFTVRCARVATDWTELSGYRLQSIVADAATKGIGDYVLLAKLIQ